MLSKRYENDKQPLLKLNELQRQMKRQVEQKVESGTYRFESAPCPVCGQEDLEPLAEKDRYGLYMPVAVCRDCGLIQTNPHMDQGAYNDFYRQEYRPLYVGKPAPTADFFRGQFHKGRRIFGFLESSGAFAVDKKPFVLEVGCGAGGILHYFRQKGCRVKGVDLGEAYIDYGRSEHGLDLSVGTVDMAKKLDAKPDLIIYSQVLEHILTPNEELETVRSLLSDSGCLYIEVPGVKNLKNSYEMDFLRLLQNAHVYHFSLRTLTNLLGKNRFQRVHGDEIIRGAFKKVDAALPPKAVENDYPSVVTYLREIEQLRKRYPIPPYRLKQLPRSLILGALNAVGLRDLIRREYDKRVSG